MGCARSFGVAIEQKLLERLTAIIISKEIDTKLLNQLVGNMLRKSVTEVKWKTLTKYGRAFF